MDKGKWTNIIIGLAVAALIAVLVLTLAQNNRYDTSAASSNSSSGSSQPAADSGEFSNSEPMPEKQNQDASENQLLPENDIDFRLVVLSAGDQKAVILTAKGQTKVVTVGDRLGSDTYEVLQVTPEKLVLQHSQTKATYWLFEGESGEKGRIQKFSSTLEQPEMPPSSTSTDLESVKEQ